MVSTTGWTIEDWQRAYADGARPETLIGTLLDSLDADDNAWISLLDRDGLSESMTALQALLADAGADKTRLPLYGIPVAVKDNIDVVGFATTAACPEYSYHPGQDATAVARLKAAGAVIVGKTNLDQFSTGLVGTRSPYGAVANSFNPEVISGGSSSGSASVVARGLVPFALGTDTAGSGRVPAGLNNLVGLKPTRGWFSIKGVVPACRSLDCVSVLALTVNDAGEVARVLSGFDSGDAFSRPMPECLPHDAPAIRRPGPIRRMAVPEHPRWFGDQQAEAAWNTALGQWRLQDVELVPINFCPLLEMAALLYEGPWIAERKAAIEAFMTTHREAMNPVVGAILDNADRFNATQTFKAQYRKEELVRQIDELLGDVDALLVPTAPTAPTIEAVNADPMTLNKQLGTYSNFVNLADFCALAVPAGFRDDNLPFGVTLISGAWKDRELQHLASQWLNANPTPMGATGLTRPEEHPVSGCSTCQVQVAIVGAHLTGLPLNPELTERHAVMLEHTTTSNAYRLFALASTQPPRPALKRVAEGEGCNILVEIWAMTSAAFGSFVNGTPPPLGIGNIELADGRWVKGFICEDYALDSAHDITEFGGWHAYIEANKPADNPVTG